MEGSTDPEFAHKKARIERLYAIADGDGEPREGEPRVGLKDALVQSAGVVTDGGVISRVGAPQYREVPFGFPEFLRNLTLTGGVAPSRAYIEELMPHILGGEIHPGRVFDRAVPLDEVAEGYRLMNEREALKVIARPGRPAQPHISCRETSNERDMDMERVTFHNKGNTVVCNLLAPADAEERRTYPAIVVTHPFGAVKEQVSTLYAGKLTEQGFITLVFDASYQGESGGEPHFW